MSSLPERLHRPAAVYVTFCRIQMRNYGQVEDKKKPETFMSDRKLLQVAPLSSSPSFLVELVCGRWLRANGGTFKYRESYTLLQ